MDFRYKAKVDKKWLKGRSLTDHKEDASEFETESEPTQIINQLKRDGKVAQKAVIKIVKKRESVELNYENIYREAKSMERAEKPSKNSVTKEEVFKKVYENDDMIEVDVNDYDRYEVLNEITCYLQDAAWSEFRNYEREDFEDEFPE